MTKISTHTPKQRPPIQDRHIEEEVKVIEILSHLGVAHLLSADDTVYRLSKQTPGVDIEQLEIGQKLKIIVSTKFHEVIKAFSFS